MAAAKKRAAKRSNGAKKPARRGTRTRGEPSERIVATAIELAEQGGFEAVRLRDVAAHAEVALGTLYRRFRSKEELLLAALDFEFGRLHERVVAKGPVGEDPLERVMEFFVMATRVMLRKPNLTRATLRAVSSGDPELMGKVAGFHGRIAELIARALHGDAGADDVEPFDPTDMEVRLAFLLGQVWFALLVGWAAGLHGQTSIVDQMRFSAELALAGADHVQT